jgi:putative restriction endonuclease
MGIPIVVAVTDENWFELLRQKPDLDEVNFWAPSAANFRALPPGGLFLFKLHAPRNFIVGGGIFAHANSMPCSLAWETFREANGARSAQEMRLRIVQYRKGHPLDRTDFQIGCRILTQPFFLQESSWIPVPPSWSRNIVSFKTYHTDDEEGLALWQVVMDRMEHQSTLKLEAPRFGEPRLIRPRLGQGAFRVLVTDTYGRRCAITQERTLPALEAAHIRPFSTGGEHELVNGLLLRRDIHSLFDAGYVTLTQNFRFEVSRRIREEFENGKDYYRFHGGEVVVPADAGKRPDPDAIAWHNENCYRG